MLSVFKILNLDMLGSSTGLYGSESAKFRFFELVSYIPEVIVATESDGVTVHFSCSKSAKLTENDICHEKYSGVPHQGLR